MNRYFKTILMTLTLVLSNTLVFGQDGEGLFKAKCSACHMVDKNSTGPLLKGAKQKWIDAGEGDMIYEWVKGPEALILSGKSKMATEIKEYSPTMMNNQEVSNEEVDAILDYIDTYEAPAAAAVETTAGAGTSEPVITYVPNYKQNLSLFWWLIATAAILLISILMLSGSVRTLVNSDMLRNKLIERKNNDTLKNLAIIAGTFGLLVAGNTASAFSFNGPGSVEAGMPWLQIENSDLYILIAINIVLVGVLFYVRGLFKEFMNIISPPAVKEVKQVDSMKRINKILLDHVDIADEKSILMDHEYDGIQELDNNLPPWWVWMFYATIVFGIIYTFNYHILGTSDLQIQAYEKEMEQSKKDIDEYLSKMAMNVDENNATLMTEASDISAGKGLFEANCVSCHNPKGEGNIGPNLTDDFWLYGNDVKDLFKTIKYGNANGMPEHASKMNPVQIQQAASYVLSLPFTKGKEPQGTEIKE